ncbi:MAG: hypothetical protein WHV44_09810 [Anaerolineales bacterium]
MKKIQSTHYKAYLLRLWREGNDSAWRATLEDAHSDTQRGFASLQALFDFLSEVTGQPAAPREGQDVNIIHKGEKK